MPGAYAVQANPGHLDVTARRFAFPASRLGQNKKREAHMLMRFDPMRDLDRLAQEIAGTAASASRTFPMDAYRRGDAIVLKFDLPGVEPNSIDLTVDQNVLTVRAERAGESEDGVEVLAAERP